MSGSCTNVHCDGAGMCTGKDNGRWVSWPCPVCGPSDLVQRPENLPDPDAELMEGHWVRWEEYIHAKHLLAKALRKADKDAIIMWVIGVITGLVWHRLWEYIA